MNMHQWADVLIPMARRAAAKETASLMGAGWDRCQAGGYSIFTERELGIALGSYMDGEWRNAVIDALGVLYRVARIRLQAIGWQENTARTAAKMDRSRLLRRLRADTRISCTKHALDWNGPTDHLSDPYPADLRRPWREGDRV